MDQTRRVTPPRYTVPGTRTVRYNPLASPDHCREGVIDHYGYRGRIWRTGTIQEAIEQMDEALGKQPESVYRIEE